MASYKRNYRSNKPAKPTIAPGSLYRPITTPSDEQQRIFDAVLDTKDNLLVDAYAGCGKTTVCVEAMHRTISRYPNLSQGYIIFAKRNQEEAVGKCPSSVQSTTAHSFGLRALTATYGRIMIDKNKNERLARQVIGEDEEREGVRHAFGKALDLAKDYLATTPEEIDSILDKHGIELEAYDSNQFCDQVLQGMKLSAEDCRTVSFSDMTWLPIKLGIRVPAFDVTYADEFQDLNKARFELVFRAAKSGRIVAVGDVNQAIFGFSGADRHSISNYEKRANAQRLSLHCTFRCAKAIVKMAQRYVPDYQAADTNSEGEVRETIAQEMVSEEGARAGDFILSRTNAPLMKYAIQLLMDGRKCNIQGRDLGKNLVQMIRRSKTKTVGDFLKWVDNWAQAEIDRLNAKKRDFEHIVDKQKCLEYLCEGHSSLEAVRARIEDLFDDRDDDESRIILSTVHKAKGLERNRVWLLEKSFVVRPKTEEEIEQERNVRYVAITRAKNSLFLVS